MPRPHLYVEDQSPSMAFFGKRVTANISEDDVILVRQVPNPTGLVSLSEGEFQTGNTHRQHIMWTLELCCRVPGAATHGQ